MQITASQRFVSRHEMAVASFNMSRNRPRFEGRPAKGSRPPCVKQSQGEITEMSPSGPAQPRSEADWDISNLFSFDSNPEPNRQNLHRGEASRPPEPIEWLGDLPGGGLRSCGVPPEGSADPISKMMDPDSTRTYSLASSLSAILEPSRQVSSTQPLRLRKSRTG